MHKGYKCLDISTGRVYIFRDVIFDENIFPFTELHLNAGTRYSSVVLLLLESSSSWALQIYPWTILLLNLFLIMYICGLTILCSRRKSQVFFLIRAAARKLRMIQSWIGRQAPTRFKQLFPRQIRRTSLLLSRPYCRCRGSHSCAATCYT
jgi:hypothetical protein